MTSLSQERDSGCATDACRKKQTLIIFISRPQQAASAAPPPPSRPEPALASAFRTCYEALSASASFLVTGLSDLLAAVAHPAGAAGDPLHCHI